MNKLLLENSLSPGITPHNAINQPCCECSWQDPQSHKSKLSFLLLTVLNTLEKQVSLQGHVLSGGLFLELHSGRESILHIYTLLQAVYVTKAYWTSTFSSFHFKKMNQCFTSFSPLSPKGQNRFSLESFLPISGITILTRSNFYLDNYNNLLHGLSPMISPLAISP